MSVATEPMLTMTPEAVTQLKTFLSDQGTPEHASACSCHRAAARVCNMG